MKAIVLAAGIGTRLQPLTKNVPKPMMSIGGRPLLEHILINLRDQGILEIIINLHHLPEVITDHFSDGRRMGLNIDYSFEPQILGTAGAVKNLEAALDSAFLVVYGDNYCRFDIQGFVDIHTRRQGLGVIGLTKGTDPTSGGIARIDKRCRVVRFLEKPATGQIFSPLINAGIYLLEPDILRFIPAMTFYDFGKDLFPNLLRRQQPFYGYAMNEDLRGINTIDEYREAKRHFWHSKSYRPDISA